MRILLSVLLLLVASVASASGLVINATEIGVGKFHRYDNKQHPYSPNNAWAPHITPDNAGKTTPVIFGNADGSVTVQFSSLEEMLRTLIEVAKEKNQKIAVLNINGHGMPGGMWYPKDEAQKKSGECRDWVASANAPDSENYNQYYSPVSKFEILQLRATANHPAHYACVTGVPEWKEVVARIPDIKNYFADDAQIHFESCLVGLGPVGETFTNTVASLLLSGKRAMVKTSLNFGLGDWSMPEGMGFWDYFTDEQLDRDNKIYPVDRQDREIMKKGSVRVASQVNGQWQSSVVADQDFMLVGPGQMGFSNSPARVYRNVHQMFLDSGTLPPAVHIPGTNKTARRL